jgi:hypothetical protein
MCQPFGTNVTTVCRLPHAKAITGQIILYIENFNKATKSTAPALEFRNSLGSSGTGNFGFKVLTDAAYF